MQSADTDVLEMKRHFYSQIKACFHRRTSRTDSGSSCSQVFIICWNTVAAVRVMRAHFEAFTTYACNHKLPACPIVPSHLDWKIDYSLSFLCAHCGHLSLINFRTQVAHTELKATNQHLPAIKRFHNQHFDIQAWPNNFLSLVIQSVFPFLHPFLIT